MRKRFVKLLLFKVDTQYRLLYGFSSETEESSYPWKAFPADRKGQKLIAKAILSPSEADNFLISLTGTEPIMLCERVTLKSPQLYKREQLLYSDDEEQQTVPISEFCYLSEFWNREKLSLLSEIQNEFNADGRKLYEQTLELLEWAKCNCGIDFCIDGRRFGNYEVYYRTPENSSFEIDIHKDQGLRVTTIRKCKDFAEDIIVNCGNVKKCAVGKHPKSEKHGNTAQFSEVERSGTQENCGGIGSGCRLRLHPLPVLRRRQSHRVACIDPDAVVVDKNIAKNDRFDLFSR